MPADWVAGALDLSFILIDKTPFDINSGQMRCDYASVHLPAGVEAIA
jgi:hypothetical protein